MEMVYGKMRRDKNMWVSGKQTRLMATECM
jgi:hypothetical protein